MVNLPKAKEVLLFLYDCFLLHYTFFFILKKREIDYKLVFIFNLSVNGVLRVSDVIKLDRNDAKRNILAHQKLIIYENISIDEIKNSFVIMNLVDNPSKKILSEV